MIKFRPMAGIIPEGKKGIAEVKHFEVSKEDSEFTMIRAVMYPEEYVPPGTYCRLRVDGQLVMTDTLMEQNTNRRFLHSVEQSGGHILIAGLGLGMILIPLFKMPKVKSISIIEKHQDVVDLVLPALRAKYGYPQCPEVEPRRCTVITADVKEWVPPVDCRGSWDFIYFDIWPTICGDDYQEMVALKEKFRPYLKRYGWIRCWSEDRARVSAGW